MCEWDMPRVNTLFARTAIKRSTCVRFGKLKRHDVIFVACLKFVSENHGLEEVIWIVVPYRFASQAPFKLAQKKHSLAFRVGAGQLLSLTALTAEITRRHPSPFVVGLPSCTNASKRWSSPLVYCCNTKSWNHNPKLS